MGFSVFFWDFDGTLYDTYPNMAAAFRKTLNERGLDLDEGEIMRRMKITLRSACETVVQEHPGVFRDAIELEDAYHTNAAALWPEGVKPYPGAAEMLRAVQGAGGRNFLFTHRGESVMRVLEADGMTGYFTEIVTSLYGFPRKPSPEGLHYLIDKYALDRRQCCMVGDRLIDIACGKNAGVSRILFDPDGYMEGLEAEARFARMDDMRAALIGKEG